MPHGHSLAPTAVALAMLFLGASGFAQTTEPPEPQAEKLVLANGLTVLLSHDAHASLVSVLVSYKAGTGDEPDGLRGLAHLVEHLVAQRTHVGDAMRVLDAVGACRVNAQTSIDNTAYFETLAPERLETALWIESDLMGYGAEAATEERIAAQRAVIENEDRERRNDAALGATPSFTYHALFPDWHPYIPDESASGDLDRIHAIDVAAFLRTWYSPSNATLAIAGAFDRDKTIAIVKKYFETLRPSAVPRRPPLADWVKPPLKLTVQAQVPDNSVVLSWRSPAEGGWDDAALEVAATALAGPANHLLSRALIAARLARVVSARQRSMRAASVFEVMAIMAPGADPRQIAPLVQQEIEALARGERSREIDVARGVRERGTRV